MNAEAKDLSAHLEDAQKSIDAALDESRVALLPALDVFDAFRLLGALRVEPRVTMLDPWYNKGVGGVRPDYEQFVEALLVEAGRISEHVFFWGFPEIVAPLVRVVPKELELTAWLTWYYKNSPSVIRGWRSSQMTCLHLTRPGARLHPEHFLNEAQLRKQAEGKLRYMPGPTSVIDEPLLVGFCGRAEQVGHKAQKPVAVFRRLLLMTTVGDDLVFDPMCGAGTTGAAAVELGRRAILSDHASDYIEMTARRLGVSVVDVSGSAGAGSLPPPPLTYGLTAASDAPALQS